MLETEEKKNKFWIGDLIIPVEILFNENLTDSQKRLFSMIELLDGPDHCFVSNGYLALWLQTTITTVSKGVSALKKENFIEEVAFDGRKRVLKVTDYKKVHYEQTRKTMSKIINDLRKISTSISKKLLFNIRKSICENCGITNHLHLHIYGMRLHLHHIDKNRKNNQLLNFKTLCCNCHKRVHKNLS